MVAPASIVELYSALKCESGNRLGTYTQIAEDDIYLSHAENRFGIQVPRFSITYRDGARGQIIRFTNPLSGVSEWVILETSEGTGRGQTRTAIQAGPVRDLLGQRGLIREVTAGGRTITRFAIDSMLPADIIANYVLTNLTADGLAWLDVGTVDPTTPLTFEFADWTRLQLLLHIAQETVCKFRLRRVGDTGYEIDVATSFAGANPVLVHMSKQLYSYARRLHMDTVKSRLVGRGLTPDGGETPASVAEVMFEVTGVSGADITVKDPDDGAAMVGFDNQHASRFVRLADGTEHEILDSVAPDTLTLDSASGIAVGDKVALMENDTGVYVDEIEHPTADDAPAAGIGRVVGVVSNTERRGEANLLPNPYAQIQASSPPSVTTARANGAASGTALTLKELAANEVIPNGSVLLSLGVVAVISTGGTANGSGDLAVTLDSTYTILDNYELTIYKNVANLPHLWTRGSSSYSVFLRRESVSGNLSCLANGTQSTTRRVNVDGLTAGDIISAGDGLRKGATLYAIENSTVANGSGQATLELATRLSFTDNDALTIERVVWPAEPETKTYLLMIPRGINQGGGRTGPHPISPKWKIDFDTDYATIHFRVGLSYIGAGTVKGSPATGEFYPAKLHLIDDGTGLDLDSATDIDRTLTDAVHFSLGRSFILTATKTVKLGLTPLRGIDSPTTAMGDRPYTALRWVMVHAGPEISITPVEGSHANGMLGELNREHTRLQAEQDPLELPIRDLAFVSGLASELLEPGLAVQLEVPELGVQEELEIAAITPRIRYPQRSMLTLISRPLPFTESAQILVGGGHAAE